MLMMYNFLTLMCMKSEYSLLSLHILGPRSPGNDIDIYLQQLMSYNYCGILVLKHMITSRNQTFQMRSTLMWTINDFYGLQKVSYLALVVSQKMCYMDHRDLLSMDIHGDLTKYVSTEKLNLGIFHIY